MLFLPKCGNNFGMPQVQLPIFPAGVTHINSEVAFEERDGQVYYFNGHLPIYVHGKGDLATFRLFTTQLVINGSVAQSEIARAFGQQIDSGSMSTGPRVIGPGAGGSGSGSATGDFVQYLA